MTCKGSSIITVFDNVVQKHRRTLKFKCSNYGKPSQLLDCISNSKEKRIINIVCMPTLHDFLWKHLKQLSLSLSFFNVIFMFLLYIVDTEAAADLFRCPEGKPTIPFIRLLLRRGDRQDIHSLMTWMDTNRKAWAGWTWPFIKVLNAKCYRIDR